MIEAENLPDIAVILTARKLQLCKIIKSQLEKERIDKSEDEIARAVSKINNAFFITESEKQSNSISINRYVLPDLIKQHPNLLNIIQRELSD